MIKFKLGTTAFTSSVLAIAVALPLAFMPVSAIAAGDGDSGSDASSSSETKKDDGTKKADAKKKPFKIKCFGGKIFDLKAKKCVAEEKSSSLDQDSIYTYGRDLARAGQYDNAIRVLYLAPDQGDPRVLNYLGYSNRKMGRIEHALRYYHAAVATNPDYSLVREYLGEAYIQLGELEKARAQLSEIERICGSRECREYGLLANMMIESQKQ